MSVPLLEDMPAPEATVPPVIGGSAEWYGPYIDAGDIPTQEAPRAASPEPRFALPGEHGVQQMAYPNTYGGTGRADVIPAQPTSAAEKSSRFGERMRKIGRNAAYLGYLVSGGWLD